MAPRVGFEPTTSRLTVGCSTTELPRNRAHRGCAYSRGIPAGASAAPARMKKEPGDERRALLSLVMGCLQERRRHRQSWAGLVNRT